MKKLNHTCLFAHHNPKNKIAAYVIFYLKELSDLGFKIIFISNSPVTQEYKTKLSEEVANCIIIERPNKGNDFGAWKWAFDHSLVNEDTDGLLFANDSVFGPLLPLKPVFEFMNSKSELDFWGLTDSYQGEWHIQSYFMYFSANAFSSDAFKNIFKQNFDNRTKLEIIEKGEIALTRNLLESGYKGKALIPYRKLDGETNPMLSLNSTHFFWQTLITKFKFPFVKRELLLQNPENLQSVGNIFSVIRQVSTYNIENIKSFIAETNDHEILNETLRLNVLCHIYYSHSIYNFLSKLAVLKAHNTKFFFNLSDALAVDTDFVDILERSFPHSVIIRAPDKGRDIGGKLAVMDILMKTGAESEYTLIIHDKFSPHTPTGKQWRDKLFKAMDPDEIENIVNQFEKNPKSGIIAGGDLVKNEYNPDRDIFDCTSSAILSELIEKYELKLNIYNFVAGAIFWVRTEILQKFFSKNLPLTIRMSLEEGNALDFTRGTFIHSWERLLSMIAEDQGFRIKGI